MAVCVDGEDATRANGGKIRPSGWKFRAAVIVAIARDAVAALHDDDDFRACSDDLFGSHAEGWRACAAEKIDAAGARDHLWNPVTTNVKRVEPFETGDARTRSRGRGPGFGGGFDGGFDLCDAPRKISRETICLGKAPGGLADFANVVPNSSERLRLKRQNLRRKRHARQRSGKVVGRSGAYVAQILSDYEIRGEGAKQNVIDRVDTLATPDEFAYLTVKLGRRNRGIHTRTNERRLLPCLGWKIAFVRDADDRITEAERVKNFRRGREKRGDAHRASLPARKCESKANAAP